MISGARWSRARNAQESASSASGPWRLWLQNAVEQPIRERVTRLLVDREAARASQAAPETPLRQLGDRLVFREKGLDHLIVVANLPVEVRQRRRALRKTEP